MTEMVDERCLLSTDHHPVSRLQFNVPHHIPFLLNPTSIHIMRRPKHGKPPLPASSHSAPRGKLPPLKHTLRYIDPATVLAEKYPSDRSPDDSSGTEGEEDKKKELPVIDLAVLCEGAKEMKRLSISSWPCA